MVQLPLKAATRATVSQPLRDLDQIRAFLSGTGPPALFDLPWMPLYLADLLYLPSSDRRRGAGRRVILIILTLSSPNS